MKFLVGIDGSDQSENVLSYAFDITNASRDSITVVHAVDPAVYSEGGQEPIADLAEAEQRLVIESVEDAERRGMEILDEHVEFGDKHGYDINTELLYGNPVSEITNYAIENGFDGIFVGHRGLSEHAERVLGSVAKGVVARSTVPVTIVR